MLKLLFYLTLFSHIVNPVYVLPWLPGRTYFVLVSVTTVLFVVQRTMRGMPLSKLPQRKYVYSIIVVFALSIAQTGWLGGAVNVLINWGKIAIVFILLVDMAESARDLRRSLLTVIAAVAALAWMGWYVYLNTPELLTSTGRLEAGGDYSQPNSFALALTVGAPLAFALLETAPGFVRKVPYVLLLGVFGVSSVFTRSRGGNLGFAVAILTSVIFSPGIRSRAFKAVLVGVMVAGMTVSVPIILARGDVATYFGGDASAENRIDAWVAGLRMIRDHPILGVGLGEFPDHAGDYGANKMIAHNTFLSVTAETGLTGGLLFVLILVTTLRLLWDVWRQASSDPSQRDLACLSQGILIGLVAFLINTSFSVKHSDPLLWALLGLAGSVVVVHRRLLEEANASSNAELAVPLASTARLANLDRDMVEPRRHGRIRLETEDRVE